MRGYEAFTETRDSGDGLSEEWLIGSITMDSGITVDLQAAVNREAGALMDTRIEIRGTPGTDLGPPLGSSSRGALRCYSSKRALAVDLMRFRDLLNDAIAIASANAVALEDIHHGCEQ